MQRAVILPRELPEGLKLLIPLSYPRGLNEGVGGGA